MASTYLTRTTGTSTLNTKCTFSGWYKRGILGTYQHIFSVGTSSGAQFRARFRDTDVFQVYSYIAGQGEIQYITNRVFRDTSAWQHILISIDCTQSASNRVKIYVNGIEETSFDGTTQAEITSMDVLDSNTFQIGRRAETGGDYFDGSISHFHFIDGTAYDASAFGETDATTGEWKIKTSPSVTYGNNGFFVLKDGNSVTDQSGNSNNFTVGGGTLTKTEDCPSNVFATFNYLAKHGITTSHQYDFLKNGNTTFYTPSDNHARKGLFLTSLGATSGKYYCEYKQGGGGRLITGICNANIFNATNEPYVNSNQSALLYLEINSEIKYDGSNYSTGIQGGTSGDIFGFALDLDNKHWYIHKNGTYFNSGDPTSGSTGTGSIIAATSTSAYFNHGEMFFCAGDFDNGSYATSEWNFGNGYFGTTAVSSAGTNASNLGIFEYDVPTGYTALCTKGLNE